MGPGVWCASKHRSLRLHRNAIDWRARRTAPTSWSTARRWPRGSPGSQKQAREDQRYVEIPLAAAGERYGGPPALFLAIASPLSSYISGQTISVTGGRNMLGFYKEVVCGIRYALGDGIRRSNITLYSGYAVAVVVQGETS